MTKVISISDEAYEKLSYIKNGNESFSKVVVRLTSKSTKRPIIDFAGRWNGASKEAEKIYKDIAEKRSSTKLRKVNL
ncbi:MAG: antitoxin VapB family protein [Candidatus Aenigmatarchaeota archaeon]